MICHIHPHKLFVTSCINAILLGFCFPATAPALSTQNATQFLEQSSQAFTAIAKKAMPATVYIKCEIRPSSNAQEFANPFDMFNDEFFRRFFGGPFGGAPQQPFSPPQQAPQMTGGSGFIVTEDGYIVTNFHVVKEATQITVIFNDGHECVATLKGSDASTDLAVLKIEEEHLPYLSFGDSDALNIGEWVVAIGNPFAFDSSLTVGVVSAKGRQGLGLSPYEDYIQTDAAINPGNSGGPLLNLEGEVIGINTAIFSRSGGNMGIGFAIPSKMVENVLGQIKEGGAVQRGYLGIVLQPMDKDLVEALDLTKQDGLVVAEIMPNSPAAQGGLQQGDIILQYNDTPVKNLQKFRNEIALMNPGEAIQLKVLRNGKTIQLAFPLGAQTSQELAATELLQKLGVEVDTVTPEIASKLGCAPDMEGVVITKVKPGSAAAMAGLRPSQVIISIASSLNQQKRVRSVAEFETAVQNLSDRKHLILVVRQNNLQRFYTLKMKE